MEYETHLLDDAVVVRWVATPTREAVLSLTRELEVALRRSAPPKALWVVIDTDAADPPSRDARAAFQDNMRRVFDLCRSADIVILGQGLRAGLMRTLLRAMALVTRTRDRVHVHDGVEQALLARAPGPQLAAALCAR
jgi:hypothetical protein